MTDDVTTLADKYAQALGGDLTELQRDDCLKTAELVTLANRTRRTALSGQGFDLAEYVRIQDMADAAVLALHLPTPAQRLTKMVVEFVAPKRDQQHEGDAIRIAALQRELGETKARLEAAEARRYDGNGGETLRPQRPQPAGHWETPFMGSPERVWVPAPGVSSPPPSIEAGTCGGIVEAFPTGRNTDYPPVEGGTSGYGGGW